MRKSVGLACERGPAEAIRRFHVFYLNLNCARALGMLVHSLTKYVSQFGF